VACAAAAALAGLDALAQRGRSARPGPTQQWPLECPYLRRAQQLAAVLRVMT